MPLGAFRLNTLARFVAAGRDAVTVTAYGDAQVDTAQSKFGGASAVFDGTGDYLIIPNSSNWDLTTDKQTTIEFWFRPTNPANTEILITKRPSGTPLTGWQIITQSSGIQFDAWYSGGQSISLNGGSLSSNTWYHVALVQDGSSITIYVDGTSVASGSYSNNIGTNTLDLSIGKWLSSSLYEYTGHIDEIRISKTARYTANFTPSTTPFVNDANTLLLLHMDGTDASTYFPDDNGSGRSAIGVTAYGDAQVDTAQSKFGGASALFDGSGDYLLADNSVFAYGSNPFTWECWWYNTGSTSTYYTLIATQAIQSALYFHGANQNIKFYYNGSNVVSGTSTPALNTWHHIAATYDGTTLRIFVNGTLEGSVNISLSGTQTALWIGKDSRSPGQPVAGNIDEVRISNTARYTANFTAPTEPFVNDANTLLLLHMDGFDGQTDFIDDNGQTPEAPVEPPVVLDGITINGGSYLKSYPLTSNNMSSTSRAGVISFWVKAPNLATESVLVMAPSNTDANAAYSGVAVSIATDGDVLLYGYRGINNGWGMQFLTTDNPISTTNWHHVVVTWDRSTTFASGAKIYVDGVSRNLSNVRYNNVDDGYHLTSSVSIQGRTVPGSEVIRTQTAHFAQLYFDDNWIDLSTNIDKFYDSVNGRPVDMGTDGTASGLSQPASYHYGNTSTFYTNNGRTSGTTYWDYTFVPGGNESISDTTTDS